ncbi:peptidylprolyl isomerase [Paenibacillus glycanilyticus]|uniref:peptidylprolyl isomerase n=1 Tax=Paenibacillus glycanilyticus TaxID=126569 RepID=A0ABQ6GD42_9BACL|nr:peptidylprolyl isomerase [Paenibacillus glycanilyticus]GLX66997.1 hypothetical protein MU1_13410 [Paenibacillus glycanilyticus]
MRQRTNHAFKALGAMLLMSGAISLMLSSCGNPPRPLNVAWVNGIPIEKEEMQTAMNRERSLVINYFHEKYGVEESTTFWNGTYGGESPKDLLKKNAMNKLVRYKVEGELAAEKNLVQSLDYKSFLTEWKSENKRREQTVAEGGVIYGPVAFSEDQYLQYTQSTLNIKLKEAWARTQQIGQNQLKTEYEKTKDERYRKPDQFQVEILTLAFTDADRDHALLILKNMLTAWEKGNGTLDQLSDPYHIHYEQVDYTSGLDSVEAGHPSIWASIQHLKAGESSEIVDEQSAWVVFHVKDRLAGGYEEFEKVKDAVKNHYIEEQFNNMIEGKVRQAEITFNDQVYKALSA